MISEKQRDGEGLRKKHFIAQLLEGTHRFGKEEWLEELKGYHLPTHYEGIFVIQSEIDQYAEFAQTFSKQDQWLLKYAITNVFSEIFEKFKFPMLSEWTADRRLSYILFCSDMPLEAKEKLIQACEEVLVWVKEQLPFLVTVGIGSYVRLADEIQVSYRVAQIALKSKMVRGTGSVISAETVISRPRTDLFKHLQSIHGMVSLYRLGNEEWSKRFFEWFDGIRSSDLLSDDIVDLLQYLIFQLDRAMGELGPEFREPWQQKGMQSLTDILEKEETLTAIMNRFFNVLSRIGEEIHLSKETKGHYEILQAVREYIENHYTDPDLSLDRLSEAFHVNPKYLSQLFKENFGEGFMEFLTRLRIEHAKTLLLQTKDPIQAISGKVGYANNVSFMRSFKKMTGQSPGDFRKNSKSG
jgi:two-component system response regulator YesN